MKSKCNTCRIEKAKPSTMEMSPLPRARLAPYFRPFTFVGLDYFGPVQVVIGRRREKRWVALFTCLTIRAVHIEVVHSLSTDSCIMAIKNFVNRRGCPKEIHSDNASNFRRASKDLKTASAYLDYGKMEEATSVKEIEWKFIPPYSPHKGGAWERMVRSIKSVVSKILHDRALRDETLLSFLLEAENIINSRPLTYVPVDSANEEALTPNHFLLHASNGQKSRWDGSDKNLRKQWKLSQELTDHFWRRWVREFAPTILCKTKWFETERELSPGDIVFLIDNKTPRNTWAKGEVLECLKSRDGKVRTVKVFTANKIKTRSIHRVAKLEINVDDKKE